MKTATSHYRAPLHNALRGGALLLTLVATLGCDPRPEDVPDIPPDDLGPLTEDTTLRMPQAHQSKFWV